MLCVKVGEHSEINLGVSTVPAGSNECDLECITDTAILKAACCVVPWGTAFATDTSNKFVQLANGMYRTLDVVTDKDVVDFRLETLMRSQGVSGIDETKHHHENIITAIGAGRVFAWHREGWHDLFTDPPPNTKSRKSSVTGSEASAESALHHYSWAEYVPSKDFSNIPVRWQRRAESHSVGVRFLLALSDLSEYYGDKFHEAMRPRSVRTNPSSMTTTEGGSGPAFPRLVEDATSCSHGDDKGCTQEVFMESSTLRSFSQEESDTESDSSCTTSDSSSSGFTDTQDTTSVSSYRREPPLTPRPFSRDVYVYEPFTRRKPEIKYRLPDDSTLIDHSLSIEVRTPRMPLSSSEEQRRQIRPRLRGFRQRRASHTSTERRILARRAIVQARIRREEEYFAHVRASEGPSAVIRLPMWRCLGTSGGVAQVACGQDFVVLRTGLGQVLAFGSSPYGALGLGPNVPSAVEPQLVPGVLNPVVDIAAGLHHVIAVHGADRDTIYTWGCGLFGRLADGKHRASVSEPQRISLRQLFKEEAPVASNRVSHISAGAHYTVLIAGGVWTCGENLTGQLGRDNTGALLGPVPIPCSAKIRSVYSSGTGTAVTFRDCSDVVYWGYRFWDPFSFSYTRPVLLRANKRLQIRFVHLQNRAMFVFARLLEPSEEPTVSFAPCYNN
ncbi:MAG: hypothetical protein KVP17_002948 [Porospora cf. gigantea B]|uniref:uncharacterized protein n=1 Tax=Porospora cf. gigantea B TaxID=2853592 RepID=UPI0035717D84|nr:MAG: hypothetical protein KVP17_002948 [Porospora cf. gigantea B]